MKFRSLFFSGLLIVSAFLLNFDVIYAHPGRTDSSGCHYCRTNCAKWGLSDGQYHCHNGGSSKSSSSKSSASSSSVSAAKPKQAVVKKSNNTNLKSVKINDENIRISSMMSYETDIDEITLEVIASDSKAKVSFDESYILEKRNTSIPILVEAEDGTKKEYKIRVTLLDSNTEIQSLMIDGGSTKFDGYEINYTTSKDHLDIKVVPSSKYTKVTYDKDLDLEIGDNNFDIVLEAENGDEETYTLHVVRTDVSVGEMFLVLVVIGGIIFFIVRWLFKTGKISKDKFYCSKCHKKVSKGSNFCEYCGSKLDI